MSRCKNADGTLTECEQSTPDYAWKVPENGGFRYVELKGDVRFQNVVFGYTDKKRVLNGISLLQTGTENRICRFNRCGKNNDCQPD